MATHFQLIDESLHSNKKGTSPGWSRRHNAAWPFSTIGKLIEGAAAYADDHHDKFGSRIGDDGVLGEHWADILRGVRGLLNGDCGNLDCGTVDALIVRMLNAEGFDAN